MIAERDKCPTIATSLSLFLHITIRTLAMYSSSYASGSLCSCVLTDVQCQLQSTQSSLQRQPQPVAATDRAVHSIRATDCGDRCRNDRAAYSVHVLACCSNRCCNCFCDQCGDNNTVYSLRYITVAITLTTNTTLHNPRPFTMLIDFYLLNWGTTFT